MRHHPLADHVKVCREQVRTGKATCQQLADRFNVSAKAVQACVYGQTYGHIPGALPSPKQRRRPGRPTPLSAQDVEQIRAEYAAGELTTLEIAQKFSITKSYVSRIGRGFARTDVPGEIKGDRPKRPRRLHFTPPRGEKHPNAKLDALCIVGIRTLVGKRVPTAKIAEIFGTTPENVSMISNRKRWKHVPDMTLTPTATRFLPPAAVELLIATGAFTKAS
jgi:hypothetical protein